MLDPGWFSMRKLAAAMLLSLGAAISLPGTTLEKLSMDQLIERSTSIVRGTVVDSYAMQRGSVIYTNYRLRVSQTIKGAAQSTLEVSVPGGQLNGVRQRFSGSPRLDAGAEYVVFVWTSRTGINHTLGLAQGVFDVKTSSSGQLMLSRGAIDALMLNAGGKEAEDRGESISLSHLVERVQVVEARLK